jgi:hypothetical protein
LNRIPDLFCFLNTLWSPVKGNDFWTCFHVHKSVLCIPVLPDCKMSWTVFHVYKQRKRLCMTQGGNYVFHVEWLIHYQWRHVQQLSVCYMWTNIHADRCGKLRYNFCIMMLQIHQKYSSVLLK